MVTAVLGHLAHRRWHRPCFPWQSVWGGAMLGVMVTRLPKERKAEALSKLEAVESNVWVASAAPSGNVHLVPVTHTWNGSQIVLATGPTTRTVSNLTANPRARLAVGESRDVVMIDAVLVEAVPASEVQPALAEGYAHDVVEDNFSIKTLSVF